MAGVPREASQGPRPEGTLRRDPVGRRRLGKLRALLALLRDHGDAVEADLQRFYGVDLADFWRGRLSVRRLSVLVANLPPESASVASALGTPIGWGLSDYLLTDVYRALTGEEHPARPKRASTNNAADYLARLKAQRERLGGS